MASPHPYGEAIQIDVLTLFPGMFRGPFDESLVKRAVDRNIVKVGIRDIRGYAHDSHRTVDDYQYGGGPGMVMKPEPVFEAVEDVLGRYPRDVRGKVPVVLLSPQGRLFHQDIAEEWARGPGIVLICGHYEGVDERIRETLATDDVSIGDYVLTGGELAAMVLVDAVVRLLPGVVGDSQSVEGDSVTSGVLQYPLYTRPASYRDLEIPSVLLSGNHGEVARWRRRRSLLRTLERRPDLLESASLSEEDLAFLREQGYGAG